MCALPSERLDNVDNILTVLLFPAPFGPRRPNISPKFTEKETPEIARRRVLVCSAVVLSRSSFEARS